MKVYSLDEDHPTEEEIEDQMIEQAIDDENDRMMEEAAEEKAANELSE